MDRHDSGGRESDEQLCCICRRRMSTTTTWPSPFPSGAYSSVDATFTFSITWTDATNDEILTVLDPDGAEVGSSDGGTNVETVVANNLAAGTYSAVACAFAAPTPVAYSGKLVVTTAAPPRLRFPRRRRKVSRSPPRSPPTTSATRPSRSSRSTRPASPTTAVRRGSSNAVRLRAGVASEPARRPVPPARHPAARPAERRRRRRLWARVRHAADQRQLPVRLHRASARSRASPPRRLRTTGGA